ncbi:hypothetical protein C8R46DRAFT_1343556 [Mycena filopes]|nr:hypothetical protein C8R46DRAFT_1343556 [Mycena filopes]
MSSPMYSRFESRRLFGVPLPPLPPAGHVRPQKRPAGLYTLSDDEESDGQADLGSEVDIDSLLKKRKALITKEGHLANALNKKKAESQGRLKRRKTLTDALEKDISAHTEKLNVLQKEQKKYETIDKDIARLEAALEIN